jgi:hypothetical protein
MRSGLPGRWLALAAMVLVATGQYKDELWAMGVQNVWFPFGVGVSRTQYAYAALIVVLAALLMRRARRVWEPGAGARGRPAAPPRSPRSAP